MTITWSDYVSSSVLARNPDNINTWRFMKTYVKPNRAISIQINTKENISNEERESLLSMLAMALTDHNFEVITNYEYSVEIVLKPEL